MSIFVCIAIESEGGDDFAFDTLEYFCQVIVSRPESGLSFTETIYPTSFAEGGLDE